METIDCDQRSSTFESQRNPIGVIPAVHFDDEHRFAEHEHEYEYELE